MRAPRRLPRPLRPEQIPDPRRGSHAQPERHGVDDLVGRHDDALRRERDRAQPAGGERHDLKGPPLRADVHHPQDGEARERAQVAQGLARGQAAPALGPADEDGVGDEEEEGDPVGDAGRQGRAVDADVELVDEEPVEEGVEGGGDEEDVGARAVDLCLFWLVNRMRRSAGEG